MVSKIAFKLIKIFGRSHVASSCDPIAFTLNCDFIDLIPRYAITFHLTVSAEPLSPPTVEKRTVIGVFLPIAEKTLALVYLEMSCVTSK